MKRKILTTAIASLIAAPAALADVVVYGKVNVSLQQFEQNIDRAGLDFTNKDNWEMLSNASRFGISGSHGISDNLKAVYKLEYQYDTAEGVNSNGRELSARNMYAGLQHKQFGTLIAGKHDTPLKLIQGKVDRFNDLAYGDIGNYMVGENRQNDIVMYSSPKMAGIAVNVAFMPGEDAGCSDPTNPLLCKDDNSSLADHISASVQYTLKDVFWVGLAIDDNVRNTDIVRLAGEVYLGPVSIGLLAQKAEVNDDRKNPGTGLPTLGIQGISGITSDIIGAAGTGNIRTATGVSFFNEQDAMLVSAAWKATSDLTLNAQFGKSTTTADKRIDPLKTAEFTAEAFSLGADYKLSKQTKLFAYYTQLSANPDNSATRLLVKDDEWSTFGVGFEVSF